MIKALAYVRVSTERQAGEQLSSLADQEKEIKALAEKLGARIDQWFRDEGASGATVEKRPGFSAMLRYCESNHIKKGYVLFLNDSRFGRFPDLDQYAAIRFRFRSAGWEPRYVEGDDSENQMVRSLMRSVGGAQASEYRLNLMRNSRRGMRGAAEKGYWTRRAPMGYDRKVVYPPGAERILTGSMRKQEDEKVSLAINEDEAKIVRWMFESYSTGTETLFSLAVKLRDLYPSRKWVAACVGQVLRNPTYTGDIVAGRRSKAYDGMAEDESTQVYGKKDAHEAIISRDLFNTVQTKLARNKAVKRAVASPYILTGLVTCLQCGKYYVGGGGGAKLHPKIGQRRFYKCAGSVDLKKICPGPVPTITRHILEDAVVDSLASVIASPAVRQALDYAIEETLREATNIEEDLGPKLDARERAAKSREDNLIRSIMSGNLTDEKARPYFHEIEAEMQRIAEERRILAERDRWSETLVEEKERLLAIATDFPALVKTIPPASARELIRPWLESATFDKVTRELTLTIRKVPAVSYFHTTHWQEPC